MASRVSSATPGTPGTRAEGRDARPLSWSSDGGLDDGKIQPATALGVQPSFLFKRNPFNWRTDWFYPEYIELGTKRTFDLFVVSAADDVIPAGMVLSFWANKTDEPVCGQAADADVQYKMPELRPYQTYTLKVSIPYSTKLTPYAMATMRGFLDSECLYGYYGAHSVSSEEIVRPKGASADKYATPIPALFRPDDFPKGLANWFTFDQSPKVALAGQTFTAYIRVQNIGTGPMPKGVFLQVWPDYSSDINPTSCENTGGVLVELPNIGPSQIKTITVEGLVAPQNAAAALISVLADARCKLYDAPITWHDEPAQAIYDIMPTPSAHIVGVHPKGQLAYTITTSPKAPTANDKMTVKVKFANYGMDEGAIGKVAVWIRPVPQIVNNSTLDWVASRQGGYYEGGPCAYKNYQFFADFSDVVLQPGKSKTVTLTKVPVPETAGWWQLSVVPDIDCVLPATKTISPAPAFASFEVVA